MFDFKAKESAGWAIARPLCIATWVSGEDENLLSSVKANCLQEIKSNIALHAVNAETRSVWHVG